MSVFKDKVLLITGGTGSFGNAVLNRFLRTDIGEIRIFSRDEKKQDDMRHDFQARMPEVANKIKFYIGDVRNKSTLKYAMKGVNFVFHAAALKQVPSCEFFQLEQMTAAHPLKRLLTPDEVAQVIVHFVNSSQQLNGIEMPINAAQHII